MTEKPVDYKTHECYDLENLNSDLEFDDFKDKMTITVTYEHGEWSVGDGWHDGEGLSRIVFCPFCGEKLPR